MQWHGLHFCQKQPKKRRLHANLNVILKFYDCSREKEFLYLCGTVVCAMQDCIAPCSTSYSTLGGVAIVEGAVVKLLGEI